MLELVYTYLDIPVLGPMFLLTIFFLLIFEIFLIIRDYNFKIEQDQGSRKKIYLLITMGILVGFLSLNFSSLLWSGDPSTRLKIGLLLIWCGITVRLWAMITLGKFFHTVIVFQSGQRILECGLYRYIRHPSYLGAFILMVGIAILFGNWIGFCGLIFFVSIGLFWRMDIEEKYLISQFGEEYISYMKRTVRLIPKIY